MYFTVYKITNLLNSKIYVGVHKTHNLNDGYMGSGKIIKRAIEKYGIDNFSKEYIKICDSSNEMFDAESEIVNESFIESSETYNLKLGGSGGFDYINSNDLSSSKINNVWLGRKHTPESIERMRVAQLGISNPNLKPNVNFTFTGNKHTDETKQKIGAANSKHQSGSSNNQYGTCWIYSLVEKRSKRIKRFELESHVNDGWIKGRKIKF